MKFLKLFTIALLLVFLSSCTEEPEDINYITSAVVNTEGHLILTFNDGTIQDQGLVIPEVVDVEMYLVNFYNTEGHIISSQIVEHGEDAFAPSLELPDSVSFDEWDTDFTSVTMGLNVHPLYHYDTFTITFHGTEEPISDMTGIEYGEPVTLPTPEVMGKEFLGWYVSDSPYAPMFSMYSEIYADMNLYARYEDISYTVNYHSNGGSEVPMQLGFYDDILQIPEEPIKEDYFFNGWYYDQDEMMPVDFNLPLTEDADIYASWIQFEYFLQDYPDTPDDEMIRINGVVGEHNYVHIPEMIDGVEVKIIGSSAFRYEPYYEVHLPNTIINIQPYSFAEMPNLTSIVLPDSLEYASYGVFYNSESLSEVNLPPNLIAIGGEMFEGTAIESIVIPEGYETIGYRAFMNTPLSSIEIPSTMKVIGDRAFSNSLITEITLPEGALNLYSFAFEDCKNLISVSLPESLSYIGMNPFRGADNLTSVTLHESNPNFEKVDDAIYNEAMEILYTVLPYRTDTTFTIPETVTYTERYSISGNPYLETVLIPDSMQNYYISETFDNVESLSSIQVYDAPGTAVFASENGVLYSADYTLLYKYPEGKTDATYSLHTSTTIVYYRAFMDNPYIASVILNDGIDRLYESAFENCTTLSAINFPSSLLHIYSRVFYNADSMTSITLPATILSIGNWSFAEMDNLTSLTLNEGLTYLPYRILENSNNVTTLHIPSTINNINYSAITNANGIHTLTIDAGNTYFNIWNNTIYTEDYTNLIAVAGGYTDELFYMRGETIYFNADFGTSPNIKIIQNHYNVTSFNAGVRNMPNLQAITFYNYTSITALNSWPFSPGLDEGFKLYVNAGLYQDYIANSTWSYFIDYIVPMN